ETVDELRERLKAFLGRVVRDLLVVEPDDARRERILEWVDASDVEVTAVADGAGALDVLRARQVDCMILHPHLPDLSPAALASELERAPEGVTVPVIVYNDGSPLLEEEGALKRLAEVCPVPPLPSPERLPDQ